MKYALAISACAAEVVAYGIIGALLGWRHGGGMIPMLILLGALVVTWTAITGKKSFLPFGGTKGRSSTTVAPPLPPAGAESQKSNQPSLTTTPLPLAKATAGNEVPAGGAIWPITWAAVGAGIVTSLGFVAAMLGVFDHTPVPQVVAPPVAKSTAAVAATSETEPHSSAGSASAGRIGLAATAGAASATEKQGHAVWDDDLQGERPHKGAPNDWAKLLSDETPPNQDRPTSPTQRATESPKGKWRENDPSAPDATPLSPEDLYERLAPSVVTIEVKDSYGELAAVGSGFFVDKALVDARCYLAKFYQSWAQRETQGGTPTEYGYVLTNYHVIQPAVFAEIVLQNGDKGKVDNVIVEDEQADLALLSVLVKTSRPLNAIPLSGNDPRVLATVYAIGSPKGLSGSASEGKISGLRELPEGGQWLQTTAPISPGSSGGPLLLSDGTVAGVTTLSIKDGQNLNFAVPVSKLRAFLMSGYAIRDISEGASIWWAEQDAFMSMSVALKSQTGAATMAGEKLERAHQEKANRYEDKSGPTAEHFSRIIALAGDADQSLPNEFKYLMHYVLGEAYLFRAIHGPNDSGTLMQQQSRFRVNADSQQAYQHLSQAVARKPDFPPALENLRSYHTIAGDWIEALRASDSLVKSVPRCADALQKRAKCYDELGRYHSAKADLEAAIDLAPRNADLHFDLGFECFSLNDCSRAVECYRKALALGTARYHQKWDIYQSLGNAYYNAGNFRNAIAAYQASKALVGPTSPPGVVERTLDAQISKCKERLQ